MNPECGPRCPSQGQNLFPIQLALGIECPDGLDGSSGYFQNGFEEECKPCFPVAGGASLLQEVVIALPVLFEIKAEVEQRLMEYAF